MWGRALTIGGVVLAARLLTLPRAPWDARELQPFFVFAGLSIAVSVAVAVVLALREPVAALLFSFSAAMLVHGVTALWPRLAIPEELPLPHEFSIARFALHPWGSKLVFLPLLVAVIAGIRPALQRRELEPLAWATFAYLAIGIAVVDPRDGVRFAIPSLIFVSIVAAEGLKALRVPWIGVCVLAALSIVYTYPLLRERVVAPSPLLQARQKPGVAFSRGDADAWGKLTRVPRSICIEPAPEFRPGVGVFGGDCGWRWIESYAELSAPRPVTLTLRLPSEAKIEVNDVRVNGALVRVRRGESVTVRAAGRVILESARAFALDPPDTRTVAVQLR
jgi:hypothetical protein